MSCETDIEQAIRESGRRFTTQRAKIMAALRHGPGHQTAEEIHAHVSREDPHAHISLSTVYRTLETLCEMRLATEFAGDAGSSTFEWTDPHRPHHHLLCDSCGGHEEVTLPGLERLEEQIERRHGFAPAISHLAIRGICQACRAEEGTGARVNAGAGGEHD